MRLQRQTALEREEKKKVDKKEKKEKELEEEMHRLHTVHYTRGLKHQVTLLCLSWMWILLTAADGCVVFVEFRQIWKQKGEEYRLHAQWGWQWLSSTRPIRRADARQCGLRAGPWRVVTSVEGTQRPRIGSWNGLRPISDRFSFSLGLDIVLYEILRVCLWTTDSGRRAAAAAGGGDAGDAAAGAGGRRRGAAARRRDGRPDGGVGPAPGLPQSGAARQTRRPARLAPPPQRRRGEAALQTGAALPNVSVNLSLFPASSN